MEKEVEREPEPISLAVKQLPVGTSFTEFVIPSWVSYFFFFSFLGKISQQRHPTPPIFFLQCKGKIKPATAHPWWPLPSGCPALHPPAMKAKNLAVPLSSPQPHLNPYPRFPLTQLCRANYWNFFATSLACGWKHSATDPKVGTAIGIRIEPKNARFPVGLCACLHFQDVLFLIITKANNTRQRLMKVLWS